MAWYIELRKSSARGTDSLAADIMRHLHARQHLGKAVIVTSQPHVMLAAARKQWLKLSRTIQKQRASTLNADKILKYTHTITRMQHMQFAAKSPLYQPTADVYFLEPQDLNIMPVHCWTVYATTHIVTPSAKLMLDQMPLEALVVDYQGSRDWENMNLEYKKVLEEHVVEEWHNVKLFLSNHDIEMNTISHQGLINVEALDDALDTLLGVNRHFFEIANRFQRALELARPLRISKEIRAQYDSFVLMAHRVQALLPGAFTQRYLELYNEDDTFFLYDRSHERLAFSGETLAEMFTRHTLAGRHHLAHALQAAAA